MNWKDRLDEINQQTDGLMNVAVNVAVLKGKADKRNIGERQRVKVSLWNFFCQNEP